MLAVTFQAPGEVRVEERPDPEPQAPDDAVVRVETTGVCGSDLHIYHGRHPVEPGFTIGHEFVGTVLAAGDAVERVGEGDRVAVLGLGPVGLCAVQAALAAGAVEVFAIDIVADRLEMARAFGAIPLHLTEQDPRAEVKRATNGRGLDACIEAVGHPDALELAIRLARNCGRVSVVGVYAERQEVHMGLVWIKSVTLATGQTNVIAHVDTVLDLMAAGRLDPAPLVTHHMPLGDAPEAYALFDRREALKIVLEP